jgi:hypothetical protein
MSYGTGALNAMEHPRPPLQKGINYIPLFVIHYFISNTTISLYQARMLPDDTNTFLLI